MTCENECDMYATLKNAYSDYLNSDSYGDFERAKGFYIKMLGEYILMRDAPKTEEKEKDDLIEFLEESIDELVEENEELTRKLKKAHNRLTS